MTAMSNVEGSEKKCMVIPCRSANQWKKESSNGYSLAKYNPYNDGQLRTPLKTISLLQDNVFSISLRGVF